MSVVALIMDGPFEGQFATLPLEDEYFFNIGDDLEDGNIEACHYEVVGELVGAEVVAHVSGIALRFMGIVIKAKTLTMYIGERSHIGQQK